jgi:integrase
MHAELQASLYRQSKFGEKPDYLWNDAVIRWLTETSHKRSAKTDKSRLRWLHDYLDNVSLASINRDMIERIANAKRQDGASIATVNRHLALIRSILRKASREWEWIDKYPAIRLKKEDNKRIRWLTGNEAERLKRELPQHLADAMWFTLQTGFRESNTALLEWSEIDITRGHAYIPAHKSKSGKAIAVPLNSEAIGIIKAQIGQNARYVFTYQGKPVSRFNNSAWRKALNRCGITDFRWHDLRHTWASWHVQNGTSLHELQQLGGWASYEMVLRYAHLSSEHLKIAANRVTILLLVGLRLV